MEWDDYYESLEDVSKGEAEAALTEDPCARSGQASKFSGTGVRITQRFRLAAPPETVPFAPSQL